MPATPPTRPADFPATPRRLVVAVALAVLLVHALVVEWVPLRVPRPAPVSDSAIVAVEVAPPPPPPPAPPPPAPAPTPAPRAAPAPAPRPRPAPARPQPAPPAPAAPAATAPPEPTPIPAPEAAPVPPSPGAPSADAGAGEAAPASGGGAQSTAGGPAAEAGKTAQVHAPVQLSFALSGLRGGVQPWSGAFGELSWRQDGSSYRAELALKIFFRTIRRQTSTGQVSPQGIAPERFTDARKNESVAELRRDSGQVVFSSGAPPVPLRPGAQDRLSVVMQLGALLAGDPARFPPGSEITLQTVGPRDAEPWVFKVGGEEKVSVPAGEFVARRLSRQARHAGDYALDLWLAPSQAYLPVQMRQTEPDGDVFDLQLREISQP